MRIEINFRKDIADFFREELRVNGYKNIPDNERGLIDAYFKVMHRIISFVPRKIKKSDVFKCPSELIQGLEILENKISKGENINPYQSEGVMDIKINDALLNDWGILHLHLGVEKNANGFIKRSGPLLYVFFTEDTAYFLNVLGHGEWTNKSLLEILDRNWSGLLGRQANIIDIEELDSDSMKKIRKAGGTFFTKVNSKIFAPPGGGYATAGNSISAVMQSNHLLMKLREYENWIRNNERYFEKRVRRLVNANVFKLELKPVIKKGILLAIDKNYNISFELGNI